MASSRVEINGLNDVLIERINERKEIPAKICENRCESKYRSLHRHGTSYAAFFTLFSTNLVEMLGYCYTFR